MKVLLIELVSAIAKIVVPTLLKAAVKSTKTTVDDKVLDAVQTGFKNEEFNLTFEKKI